LNSTKQINVNSYPWHEVVFELSNGIELENFITSLYVVDGITGSLKFY